MLSAMLATGQSELSCFARYEGTLVRCRPDLMAYDAEGRLWVVDLKKLQDASRDEFRRHAREYKYAFQEAWYRFVLGLLGMDVYAFRFAAVEEEPPHGVAVYPLARENVIEQEPNVHRAIGLAVQCAEQGRWPGYDVEQAPIGWRTQT
jgi:hypothetical protein